METKPYQTADLSFAAYLCSHYNRTVLGTVKLKGEIQAFVFEDFPERPTAQEEWMTGHDAAAPYKLYFRSERMLKKLLKNPIQ